ncbi:MAG: 16S rRNA (uracil(1498)-N(3))-methyltransferase [Gammaproteobacteria bacterium]|nr:16S rRNA (uracil(1498)-N(3))-methyltransferase [Gammaproteobacteria bacterium]
MNLVMLFEDDFVAPGRAVLSDRRLTHIREIHRAGEGDRLRVGLLQGGIGSALIERMTEREVTLALTLQEAPPAPLPVTLILALPRPKMLKRCLGMVAEMGVKRLYMINSVRVEKSYWQSPWLHPEKIHGSLLLGLEQARDTMLPEVHLRRRFKPFVEDELPGLIDSGLALLAHPAAPGFSELGLRLPLSGQSLLCIGPEGGFIPYEVGKLISAGCRPFSLGARIYRVETALPLLLGKLFSG